MTIYSTRYQAKKNALYGEVIVKVDAGCGDTGYTIMTAEAYRVWKRQK